MEWLNPFGLLIIAVIMIPNILFAVKCKDSFANRWSNKAVETMEQIGRFGCFGFMIFNIPGTCLGWWSDAAFIVCFMADAVLVILYCAIWAVFFQKKQFVQSSGTLHHSLCFVLIQRDHESFAAFNLRIPVVCTQSYSHFVQKRKIIFPRRANAVAFLGRIIQPPA